jgi:phosphatidylinositol phospholipase C delta
MADDIAKNPTTVDVAAPAPLNQAGGGISEAKRVIKSVDQTVLGALRRVYDAHAGGQKWNGDHIKTFVQTVQRHGADDPVSRYLLARPELDFSSFLAYMASESCAVTLPPPWQKTGAEGEDLSWPLASYYISSSHNTYLTGNQLSSASTTEAYTNVLRRGCRCVEIDVWDGDDSDTSDSESESDSDDPNAKKNSSWRKKGSDSGVKRRSTIGFLKDKLARVSTSRHKDKSSRESSPEKKGGAAPGGAAAALAAAAAAPAAPAAPTPAAAAATTASPVAAAAASPTPEVAIVEPRVLHGYTLTKEVSFRDVCTAIKESAFVVSDLPLIVSLEVHCGPEQQLIMVKIMRETWGDLLALDDEAEPLELPSPEQLRGKILVKVKYVPKTALTATTSGASAESDSLEEEEEEKERLVAAAAAANASGRKEKEPKKRAKIIPELSELGSYCHAVSFKSFEQPEASMPTHIFSLAEKKFLSFVEDGQMQLSEHNRRFLLRAYPSGLRIGSSNLNPAPFWGAGAQIVALNWQQTDEGMMLNEGMFAGTGGYVLKPPGETTPFLELSMSCLLDPRLL